MNDLVRLPHTFEEKKFNWKKAAAPAGAALLLVALGWGAGAKLDSLHGPSPEQVAAQAAAASAEKVFLHANQAHKKDIVDLRAHVDGLKSRLEAQAEKARGSEAAIAALHKNLAEEKAQSQALHARLEKLQASVREAAKEPAPKPQADRTPTATIAPPAAVAPPAAAKAAVKPAAPKRYGAYVLRDINDGVAMVEGADGVEEVEPGDRLPGGARVQRFERRGNGWIVLTDRGFIAPEGWN